MNILNIILLSCSVAVTIAQKVADTRNDIIDPRRNTGGYGLLRPGSQGGYNQGGNSQGGYNQGGFNRPGYGGYSGYNGGSGGVTPGGYGQGYGGNQGYGQSYGGNQGYGQGYGQSYGGNQGFGQGYGGNQGFGQGYGGNQGFGQGYGGNQGFGQGYGGRPGYGGSPGYSGGRPGLGSYPGLNNYPGGYGGTGGYGSSGVGGRPSGFGQGLQSQYPAGYRPRPQIDPDFPELGAIPSGAPNPYYSGLGRPIGTPFNYHTGLYYGGNEDGYTLSNHLRRQIGEESKAGKIFGEDKKS